VASVSCRTEPSLWADSILYIVRQTVSQLALPLFKVAFLRLVDHFGCRLHESYIKGL